MSTALATIDVTNLVEYVKEAENISTVSKMHAPMHLQKLIKGMDCAAELLADAVRADIKAKARLDMAESIAFLQNASAYLVGRNLKDTAEARKMYISIDPDVVAASDVKAQTEALVTLLKNKLITIKTAHDDLKKFHWGDNNMTNYENN